MSQSFVEHIKYDIFINEDISLKRILKYFKFNAYNKDGILKLPEIICNDAWNFAGFHLLMNPKNAYFIFIAIGDLNDIEHSLRLWKISVLDCNPKTGTVNLEHIQPTAVNQEAITFLRKLFLQTKIR